MKLNKIFIPVSLLLTIALVAVACAPAATTAPATTAPPAKPAQTPIVLRTSIGYSPNHIYSQGLKYFSDLVKERTNGMVDFKIYYSSELVPASEEFSAVGSGAIDAAWTVGGYFAGKVRLTEASNVPFWIMKDVKAQHDAMVEAYPLIDAEFNKFNCKNLWWLTQSFYQLPSKKLIKVPADMKGLRIRAPGGYFNKAIEAWGGTPVTMVIAETYTALQRGTVDGSPVTTPTVLNNRYHEVCDYLLAFDVPVSIAACYVNLDKWKALPAEYQKIINDTEAEVFFYNDKIWWEEDAVARGKWKTAFKGGVYVPTEAELKLWTDAVKPLRADCIKNVPETAPLFEILDKHWK